MKFQSDFISNFDSSYDVKPNPFRVGDIVYVEGDKDMRGRVSYVGEVDFTSGVVIGVNLDEPLGFHDGAYLGKRYFYALKNHGIFVRMCFLSRYPNRTIISKERSWLYGGRRPAYWDWDYPTYRYWTKDGGTIQRFYRTPARLSPDFY